MVFIAAAMLAFILNVFLIPCILLVSHKNKWYDSTDQRKIHTGNIPRTGGIGIFVSFLGSIVILIILRKLIPAFSFDLTTVRIVPISFGIAILFATGILDDFFNLRARYKLFLQVASAAIVVSAGFKFTIFALPFGLTVTWQPLTLLVTFFWIVGVTNAINLMDGIDGLAGGASGIAAFFWGVLSILKGHTFSAFIAFALLGAAAGFLVFNKPKAKIFMGDSGSLVIGFLLAVMPLVEKEAGAGSRVLLLSITLLVIPIFDTLAAIIRRRQKGQSIGSPDKEHLHHKLLARGFSVPKVLLVVYAFSVIYGFVALLWACFPETFNLFLLPFTWIPALGFFLILHYRYRGLKFNGDNGSST